MYHIFNPKGKFWKFQCSLDPKFYNSQIQYKIMIIGLKIKINQVKVHDHVPLMGDSQ